MGLDSRHPASRLVAGTQFGFNNKGKLASWQSATAGFLNDGQGQRVAQ